MGFVIEGVARYQAYLYAVCGLVALYHIYKVWVVRSERRQAVFSLERDKAGRELLGIFYVAVVLLTVMGVTYFVSNTLAKAVVPIVDAARNPQPALPFVSTPTPTALPVTPTVLVVLPTATAVPIGAEAGSSTPAPPDTPQSAEATETTPTPTAPPPPVAQASPSCADPRATISSPGSGQSVSGLISVVGTAMHSSFQYYKVEFAPGANAESNFVYLGGGSSPVQGGVLANVDTNALGPGTWTLRLVVVDQTGNFPPPCTVTVIVGG